MYVIAFTRAFGMSACETCLHLQGHSRCLPTMHSLVLNDHYAFSTNMYFCILAFACETFLHLQGILDVCLQYILCIDRGTLDVLPMKYCIHSGIQDGCLCNIFSPLTAVSRRAGYKFFVTMYREPAGRLE